MARRIYIYTVASAHEQSPKQEGQQVWQQAKQQGSWASKYAGVRPDGPRCLGSPVPLVNGHEQCGNENGSSESSPMAHLFTMVPRLKAEGGA